MNLFVAASAIALLAGCASQSAKPATTARASFAQSARTTQPSQDGELRHFYLLSPGPSSKLVVTRSDLTDASR
ncbi:MAG: hypothetical protein WDO74_05145 [Pseudomonadota bacterium]